MLLTSSKLQTVRRTLTPEMSSIAKMTENERLFGRYEQLAHRLVLVTIVFLLHLSSQTAPVRASTDFQDFGRLNGKRAVQYGRAQSRGPTLLLRNHQGHITDSYGRLLEEHVIRRQLINGLFTNRALAVKSNRIDPTNHFRHYRAGYDVTSKSYWASVAYTGVYGYAIGLAWLLLGIILSLVLCCKCCCGRGEKSKDFHSSIYYFLPRIIVLLLSLFAIGCLIALFIRNKQVHDQANKVENTIVGAANLVSNTVHNVSNTLAKVDTIMAQYQIPGLSAFNSTETSLNAQANSILTKVDDNKRNLKRLVNAVEIALLLVLSILLFLILAGLAAAFLQWRRVFYVIIALVWILAALTWILFGLFFSLNNVASDTCQALDEYLQAPANTTLDSLLPCVDLATASAAFTIAREAVRYIVAEANTTVIAIQSLSNNGSIEGLCQQIGGPPDYTYTSTCPAGTLPIGQLPEVIAPFVCMDNMSAFTCLREGRVVTKGENSTLYSLSEGAQSLLNVIPEISDLANCSFVYNTFNTFVNSRCNPAKSALRNLWIPLLLLSIALTLLPIFWILANHRNTQQRYLGTIHAQDYRPRPLPK